MARTRQGAARREGKAARPRRRRAASRLQYGAFAPEELRDRVDREGWAVIADVPCWIGNTELLAVAGSLGAIRRYGPRFGDPAWEGHDVYRISAATEAGPAETNLHSDESYLPTPSRYVLFHCWEENLEDGANSLADVDDILGNLDGAAIERCYAAAFRWSMLEAPILTRISGRSRPLVRFNRRLAAPPEGAANDDPVLAALPALFERAAARVARRCTLHRGDCLVIDNHRVLHGRPHFKPGSPRLLKRVAVRDAGDFV
ncbi:MAG: TauD/TfdA family dioxygenase [Rhodospirillaceae bacterium]|nr:TauD/TfdA family dioxygenase [Rhodospirillaceae bacterium]